MKVTCSLRCGVSRCALMAIAQRGRSLDHHTLRVCKEDAGPRAL